MAQVTDPYAVLRDPYTALRDFADRLTPDELDACAQRDPSAAIWFATPILTDARLEWCIEQRPTTAREYIEKKSLHRRLDRFVDAVSGIANTWARNEVRFYRKGADAP